MDEVGESLIKPINNTFGIVGKKDLPLPDNSCQSLMEHQHWSSAPMMLVLL
jgi:hypothetical protein